MFYTRLTLFFAGNINLFMLPDGEAVNLCGNDVEALLHALYEWKKYFIRHTQSWNQQQRRLVSVPEGLKFHGCLFLFCCMQNERGGSKSDDGSVFYSYAVLGAEDFVHQESTCDAVVVA